MESEPPFSASGQPECGRHAGDDYGISATETTMIQAVANKNGVLNLALSAKSPNGWDFGGFSRLTKTGKGTAAPASLPRWGTPQAATLHLVPLKAKLHGGHAHLCGTTDLPGGANPGFVEQKK